MAFRASNLIPETGYNKARKLALDAKQFSETSSTAFSLATDSERILSVLDAYLNYSERLNEVKAIPGIAQYARDQEDDQTYDVAAEFIALIAAIDGVVTEIKDTFPVQSTGTAWLQAEQFNADGSRSPRAFTAAQVVGIKTKVDLVVLAVV